MDLGPDAPPPVDADEPPPRKRGLGRGLAELATSGRSIGSDGQPYYSLDSIMWALDRSHASRVAERTPQPKALHRLPEVLETGPINVAAVLAAQAARDDRPTPPPAPAAEPPKPRRMSEAAAMLVRGLPGMSEALREGEAVAVQVPTLAPALAVTLAPESEPSAPEPELAPTARRAGKFAWLAEDDDE